MRVRHEEGVHHAVRLVVLRHHAVPRHLPGEPDACASARWRAHETCIRTRSFYEALERAELPRVVPHALRHRIACVLADEGESDTAIAAWLGDTAAVVAKTYRNVLVRTNDRIAGRLAARYEVAR